MDVVHHAAIGGIGMLALGEQGHELAGLGFLVGSVFPDLDVAFMAAGKRFYLRRHQGPTHSAPLAPLYAAALAAVPAIAIGWQWSLFLGLVAGMLVHVTLDLTNTFGIQILWPLTPRRFCADAVFFVDLGAWMLTLGFFAAVLWSSVAATAAASVYAVLLAAYLLLRLALQRRALRSTSAAIAIPSSWNPFEFFLMSRDAGCVRTALHNVFTGRTRDERRFQEADDETRRLTARSAVFQDMAAILRGLEVTHLERDAGGTRLVAHDLAIRNFGGRFGRTELRFDAAGRLVHEVAHI